MKKHSPLLEEKLNLEGNAVKDVLKEHGEVNRNNARVFLLRSTLVIKRYFYNNHPLFMQTFFFIFCE